MIDAGYIKLHRQMREWQWYKNKNTKALFLHCLLMANFADVKEGNDTIPCGSFRTSISKLAEELGMTMQEIRTALSNIQTTGEITCTTTNKNTTIHVQKWADYQQQATPSNKQLNIQDFGIATNQQQTNNTPKDFNKNIKNAKNNKNNTNTLAPASAREVFERYANNNQQLFEALLGYMEMRTKHRRPLTIRAAEMAVNKLKVFEAQGKDIIKIIDQSIFYAWEGLFEIKEESKGKINNGKKQYGVR